MARRAWSTVSQETMVVMNYVLKKISIRTSCLLGATIQATGIMINYLHHDMASLILCQGFMFGLGHSLLYCPTLLIVSQYFEKHRSIATAISSCGCSAGGIAFPYITRYLLTRYGLEGTMLVLGAIVFNQCIFYALFKPISREDQDKTVSADSSSNDCESSVHGISSNKENVKSISEHSKYHQDLQIDNNNTNQESQYNETDSINVDYVNDRGKLLNTDDTNLCNNRKTLTDGLSASQILSPVVQIITPRDQDKNRLFSSHGCISTRKNHSDTNIISATLVTSQSLSTKSRELLSIIGSSAVDLHSSLPMLAAPGAINVHQSKDDRKESYSGVDNNGSMSNGFKTSTDIQRNGHTGDSELVHRSLLGISDESGQDSNQSEKKTGCLPDIFRLPKFWIVAVYIVGGIISAACPALFIPPLAREKGLSTADATFFLTISSATDFLGRMFAGAIVHFKLADPLTLSLLPLTLETIFYNLTFISDDFYWVNLFTLNYGFCSGMFWVLWTLVIIDVLGLAQLGPAMGFYAVINGFTISASFPLAGWLQEATGSFSSSFHFFGATSSISALALLVFIIPKFKQRCVKC